MRGGGGMGGCIMGMGMGPGVGMGDGGRRGGGGGEEDMGGGMGCLGGMMGVDTRVGGVMAVMEERRMGIVRSRIDGVGVDGGWEEERLLRYTGMSREREVAAQRETKYVLYNAFTIVRSWNCHRLSCYFHQVLKDECLKHFPTRQSCISCDFL